MTAIASFSLIKASFMPFKIILGMAVSLKIWDFIRDLLLEDLRFGRKLRFWDLTNDLNPYLKRFKISVWDFIWGLPVTDAFLFCIFTFLLIASWTGF